MATDPSTRTYRAHEFADLTRSMATGFKLKITAEHSEESRSTKWLNVSAEELEAIVRVLLTKD
jgi:hypothetical protein